MAEYSECLRDLLILELHRAVAAQLEEGADAGGMSADLERRLHLIRRMQTELQAHQCTSERNPAP